MKQQIERTKTNLVFERRREIRSFQSKGKKQFCQLRNQQGEAKQESKKENLIAAKTIIHVLKKLKQFK